MLYHNQNRCLISYFIIIIIIIIIIIVIIIIIITLSQRQLVSDTSLNCPVSFGAE